MTTEEEVKENNENKERKKKTPNKNESRQEMKVDSGKEK